MTSLSMSVNLLRERLEVSPEQEELLQIASENCNTLAALVSDIIDAAARDANPDPPLNRRPIEIVHLLRSALWPLVPQAKEKGIALVVPAEDQEVLMNVDPVKFPWVVTNIAGNALRYTPPGGEVVVVVTPGDDRVTVSVRDTGAGIAPENLARIFQPYVSLESQPQPGTHGLGLAIAREVVEAHGGGIDVVSTPGEGTEFLIWLPMERA